MRVPFAIGVGGTFDVAAGLVKRAPRVMQVTGLEWLARVAQEPRRMFRRYFIDGIPFFGMLGVAVARRWANRAWKVFVPVALGTIACVEIVES